MSASLLSRLAVALLVAMGFVVPTEAPARDAVTQGVVAPTRETIAITPLLADRVTTSFVAPALLVDQHHAPAFRLFVKHRALLR